RLWPGQNAVGRRFRLNAGWDWYTVVGVARNVETRAARRERTDLQLYYAWPSHSAAAAPPPSRTVRRTYAARVLIVRAADPLAALADIKKQIWSVDANQPIERVALVSDLYAEAFARQRFVLSLMTVFAAIALALTA